MLLLAYIHRIELNMLNMTFIGACIVIYCYSKTNEMHQFLKFILFCSSTLHVSDGLSVHHQESKTVHTASSKSTNQMQQFLKFIT